MTTPISPLAEAIIEDKWILCKPEQAIANAIHEYLAYTADGKPYLFEDEPVDPLTFIRAVNDAIGYFIERDLWTPDKER